MTVQRTWSGERAVMVAVLGRYRQDRDRQFDSRCPQGRDPIGLVILLVGALAAELAPWRWARSVHSYFTACRSSFLGWR
jgi:hypothetical protein